MKIFIALVASLAMTAPAFAQYYAAPPPPPPPGYYPGPGPGPEYRYDRPREYDRVEFGRRCEAVLRTPEGRLPAAAAAARVCRGALRRGTDDPLSVGCRLVVS